MECAKVTSGVKKAKKKPVKDELDRVKQAEKKRRRLEKALATSAAIRSQLEKKKQKKQEEQEKLDEEGAAIAEAVALHVLLGEDSDDSSKLTLKKDEGLTSWDHASNFNFMVGGRQTWVPHQYTSKYSFENIGYGQMWSHLGNSNLMVSPDPLSREFYPQYFGDERWGAVGFPVGNLAAHAVSSLKIADDTVLDAYVFNHMLRG